MIKRENKQKTEGKYLQIIYLRKGSCPEYMKNFYSSVRKEQNHPIKKVDECLNWHTTKKYVNG